MGESNITCVNSIHGRSSTSDVCDVAFTKLLFKIAVTNARKTINQAPSTVREFEDTHTMFRT